MHGKGIRSFTPTTINLAPTPFRLHSSRTVRGGHTPAPRCRHSFRRGSRR
ncbi:hypothetical protein LEMLEM_LOCUS11046 [Lemmus lemmus]